MGVFNENRELLRTLADIQDKLDVLDKEYEANDVELKRIGKAQAKNRVERKRFHDGLTSLASIFNVHKPAPAASGETQENE